MRLVLAATLISLLAACQPAPGASNAGEEAKTSVSGRQTGEASANALCRLYTPAELSALTGLKLGAPAVAAMGSGCQWVAADGEDDVLIQVVGADHHEPHTGATGYRPTDVGERGFVQFDMGGWGAGAIVGKESVNVSISGDRATADSATALLRETIKRRAAQKT